MSLKIWLFNGSECCLKHTTCFQTLGTFLVRDSPGTKSYSFLQVAHAYPNANIDRRTYLNVNVSKLPISTIFIFCCSAGLAFRQVETLLRCLLSDELVVAVVGISVVCSDICASPVYAQVVLLARSHSRLTIIGVYYSVHRHVDSCGWKFRCLLYLSLLIDFATCSFIPNS